MTSTNSDSTANLTSKSEPIKRRWRFYTAVIAICLLNLVTALDASVVSVALPVIANELHGTGIEAFWVGTSYLLTSTVSQPSFTSFSHIFGRKALVLAGLCFFTAGCTVAGCAKRFPVLLLARSIQGIGGGSISALTSVLLTDLFPLRERGQWGGLVNLFWAIGTVAGPSIGGVLSQNGAWRWIFWLNLPFCGVGFVLITVFLRLETVPGTISSKLRYFDWIGLFLFTGSATTFLLSVTWGGVQFPWGSPATLVPLILGFAVFMFFVVYELRIPPHPLINFRLFSNRSVNAALLGTVIHSVIIFALFYYSPLYAEAVHGFSPLKAGVGLIPNALTVAPAAAVSGILISKFGHYRWALWSGWLLMTFGTFILLVYKETSSSTEVIFLYMIVGLGGGLLYTSLGFVIQASSRPEDSAACGAMFALLRLFGQTLGVAIGGVIFQNQIKSHLESSSLLSSQAGELARLASGLVMRIQMLANNSIEKMELIAAFQGAFEVFIYVLSTMSVTSLLCSAFVKGYNVNQRHVTNQGFREQ